MVVTLQPRLRRLAWLARLLLLVPAADLVAHDAIYRSLPNGEAPRALSAHGYWPLFLLVVGILGLSAAWQIVRRLRHLERTLRALAGARLSSPANRRTERATVNLGTRRGDPQRHDPGRAAPSYHRDLLRLWPAVTGGTALLFLVQENLEHVAATGVWSGLAPLDGRLHPDGLLLIAAASLLVAAVGALVRWRVALLERRLVLAASGFPPPRPEVAGPHWSLIAAICRRRWMLVRRDAGRAPPLPA
jgi:hypothetical protein